jgi:poly(3-hydroxybutyrate) depolymerase
MPSLDTSRYPVVYRPAMAASTPRPLVVVLHGNFGLAGC